MASMKMIYWNFDEIVFAMGHCTTSKRLSVQLSAVRGLVQLFKGIIVCYTHTPSERKIRKRARRNANLAADIYMYRRDRIVSNSLIHGSRSGSRCVYLGLASGLHNAAVAAALLAIQYRIVCPNK